MRAKEGTRAETILNVTMGLFALVGVVAVVIQNVQMGAHDDPSEIAPVLYEPAQPVAHVIEPAVMGSSWFESVRPYCNTVDVDTRLNWQPAPDTDDGAMYEAACLALAGRIDQARAKIEGLPADQQYRAAGVVFNIGHPAADGGDELAAGPLMELVVEYWPNHYMALYHAGAAAYERGDEASSIDYLVRFLAEYSSEDGWHHEAQRMLAAMGS